MFHFTNQFDGPLHVNCPTCNGRALFDAGDLICTACALRSDWLKHCAPEMVLPCRCPDRGSSSQSKRHACRPRCKKCGARLEERDAPDLHDAQPSPWAEVSTRHGSIWAANPDHLAATRCYVSGTRHHPFHPSKSTRRLRNEDRRPRLPRRMKLGRNRSEVLRGLNRLEKRFAESR